MFVLTVECCVTVGKRAVCWYENRSAAIKLCHVVSHTVMNVVHYCWKECSWFLRDLPSWYKAILCDCIFIPLNFVKLWLEEVQLVATETAQLLHCVIVCLNFCIFKLYPEWPHVNVFVLLRSLSWENFNGRVKCTFEYPTFSGKSLSLKKICNEKSIM